MTEEQICDKLNIKEITHILETDSDIYIRDEHDNLYKLTSEGELVMFVPKT